MTVQFGFRPPAFRIYRFNRQIIFFWIFWKDFQVTAKVNTTHEIWQKYCVSRFCMVCSDFMTYEKEIIFISLIQKWGFETISSPFPVHEIVKISFPGFVYSIERCRIYFKGELFSIFKILGWYSSKKSIFDLFGKRLPVRIATVKIGNVPYSRYQDITILYIRNNW